MKRLNLKITNNTSIDAYFLVDGAKPKFKKNEYGSYISVIETEKDEVEIKIYEWNEYKSSWWFLTSLLYFIISFFGIFDIRIDKRFRSVDCDFKIKLSSEENNLKLTYNGFKEDCAAILHDGNCEIEMISNKYYIDKKSKTRYKIMKWLKLVIWLIAIIGVILFLR